MILMQNQPKEVDKGLLRTMTLGQLSVLLSSFRFRFVTENDLQDGIEAVFANAQVPYQREQSLNVSDRPDFMVMGIAIEVKTKGSLADLLRQASRYAGNSEVSAILVVGSPHWLVRVPTELAGKPVRAVRLIGSLL